MTEKSVREIVKREPFEPVRVGRKPKARVRGARRGGLAWSVMD